MNEQMTARINKIKMTIRSLLILASLVASAHASASQALATEKNCMSCHAVERKLVGPGFKEVAKKYADKPDAVAVLAKKIRAGGVGVWGPVPMPANNQVNEAEATKLAQWILGK